MKLGAEFSANKSPLAGKGVKMNASTCEALPSVNEGLGPRELTLFHMKVGPTEGCLKDSERPQDLILPLGN